MVTFSQEDLCQLAFMLEIVPLSAMLAMLA
jgi:hypothetical protein